MPRWTKLYTIDRDGKKELRRYDNGTASQDAARGSQDRISTSANFGPGAQSVHAAKALARDKGPRTCLVGLTRTGTRNGFCPNLLDRQVRGHLVQRLYRYTFVRTLHATKSVHMMPVSPERE